MRETNTIASRTCVVVRILMGKSSKGPAHYTPLQHLLTHKYDFEKEPEKIMRELIERYGIKAIKIWPKEAGQLTGR